MHILKASRWISSLAFAIMFFVASSGVAQEKIPERLTVEQVMVPKVTLADESLISFFVNEFFIPETLVTKIDIIDATGNGFGEKDLAITYPSREIYFIFPSDTAQAIMNDWKFTANFQIVGGTGCLLYTSPSPRDSCASRMPSSA